MPGESASVPPWDDGVVNWSKKSRKSGFKTEVRHMDDSTPGTILQSPVCSWCTQHVQECPIGKIAMDGGNLFVIRNLSCFERILPTPPKMD
jgi:hypothetical protein